MGRQLARFTDVRLCLVVGGEEDAIRPIAEWCSAGSRGVHASTCVPSRANLLRIAPSAGLSVKLQESEMRTRPDVVLQCGDKLLLDACSGRAAAEGYCDPRNTNAGCDPEGGSEAETGLGDEEPAETSPPRQSIATYFCLGTIALLLFAGAGYQEQL